MVVLTDADPGKFNPVSEPPGVIPPLEPPQAASVQAAADAAALARNCRRFMVRVGEVAARAGCDENGLRMSNRPLAVLNSSKNRISYLIHGNYEVITPVTGWNIKGPEKLTRPDINEGAHHAPDNATDYRPFGCETITTYHESHGKSGP